MRVKERPNEHGLTWVTLTPDDRIDALAEALDELGMTWEQLREEASTRSFRSYEAQQVWMVLGERES